MSKSQNKIPATVEHVIKRVEKLEKLAHKPKDLDKTIERLNDFNIRLNKIEVEMGMWGGKKIIPINE